MKRENGYTLLELLLVMAIFTIFLSIVVIKPNSLVANKENKELQEFIADLNYARNMAIIESNRHYIDLYPDRNRYALYKFDNKNKKIDIKAKSFDKGNKFYNTNFESNKIIFTRTGAPVVGGTILLSNNIYNRIEVTIIIATGKVNIKYNK